MVTASPLEQREGEFTVTDGSGFTVKEPDPLAEHPSVFVTVTE